uniref:Uncharacterized protein n=1 Tax=Branchiostoma floridae TaxID=7739 RepID=C3YYI1_BRAFL|eukprot:XP_002598609.1 hypothetical protein BRAFLDRAFT_67004 [Branchiostoma floridae]
MAAEPGAEERLINSVPGRRQTAGLGVSVEHHVQDMLFLCAVGPVSYTVCLSIFQEDLSMFLWDLSAVLCPCPTCSCSCVCQSPVSSRQENIGLDCELVFTSELFQKWGSACYKA